MDAFRPGDHLRTLRGGGEYLDVKHRLVWLRQDAPDSQVITDLLEVIPGFALFRCTVTRIIGGEVRGVAMGHGSETKDDFPDYIEKAETKAIGRALANLGYGAQFIDPEPDHRPVDAPVRDERRASAPRAPERPATRAPARRAVHPEANTPAADTTATQPITARQLEQLAAWSKHAGSDPVREATDLYDKAPAQLTRAEAGIILHSLQVRAKERSAPVEPVQDPPPPQAGKASPFPAPVAVAPQRELVGAAQRPVGLPGNDRFTN